MRRGARRRLRHRDEHEAVVLRHAVLVPIVRILHELQTLVGYHLVELVGPGTGRRLGVDLVIVAGGLERAFRDHHPVRHVVGKERLDRLRVDGNRVVVYLLEIGNRVGAGTLA